MKLIIASNNAGKVREYRQLLSECGFDEVLSLKDAGIVCEPEETGATFEENSAIKARELLSAAREKRLDDCAVIADDSGLAVDALGGEPGVYSARWLGLDSDEDKNAELIRRLDGLEGNARSAQFVCAIHFIYADGREVAAKGVCEGAIAKEPQGDNGFGYDPVFLYGTDGRSFAQLGSDEKNAVSHRGNALRELVNKLKG